MSLEECSCAEERHCPLLRQYSHLKKIYGPIFKRHVVMILLDDDTKKEERVKVEREMGEVMKEILTIEKALEIPHFLFASSKTKVRRYREASY